MSQQVPLANVPSQSLQCVLGGQNCAISVYSKTGYLYTDTPEFTTPNTNLYFDLTVNGEQITSTAICLNQKRLLVNRQYLGVAGDFMFIDTQGANDPQYVPGADANSGLGSRFVLLYLTAADLAAAGAS